MPQKYNAITGHFSGRQKELRCEIGILPFPRVGEDNRFANVYSGIWDTGATNSAITPKVVKELGLKPTGIAQTSTANGVRQCNVYLIEMRILGDIVKVVNVTEADLNGADALIGMDIIGDGDFAISTDTKTGDMNVSYRTPSQGKIDFVEMANKQNNSVAHKSNTAKNKQERQNKKKARKNKK